MYVYMFILILHISLHAMPEYTNTGQVYVCTHHSTSLIMNPGNLTANPTFAMIKKYDRRKKNNLLPQLWQNIWLTCYR